MDRQIFYNLQSFIHTVAQATAASESIYFRSIFHSISNPNNQEARVTPNNQKAAGRSEKSRKSRIEQC
jgi:hypothetical protein